MSYRTCLDLGRAPIFQSTKVRLAINEYGEGTGLTPCPTHCLWPPTR